MARAGGSAPAELFRRDVKPDRQPRVAPAQSDGGTAMSDRAATKDFSDFELPVGLNLLAGIIDAARAVEELEEEKNVLQIVLAWVLPLQHEPLV